MSSEEIYYKYQAIYADDNNHALDNLTNNLLYFKDPANFNDPFDCKMYVDNKGTEAQWIAYLCNRYECPENIAKEIVEDFIKCEDGLVSPKDSNYFPIKVPSICCFSKYDNIILMWSHYANHHKGIVLGFKAIENPTASIRRTTDKEYYIRLLTPYSVGGSAERTLFQGIFNKVDYSGKDIPLIEQFGDETSNYKIACNQLFTKHSDWHYEEEYRIINIDSDPKPESILDPKLRDRIFEYGREDLKKVIFGCKITKDIAQRVYDIINKENLDAEGNGITKYYEAKESKVKCEINIEPIPDIDIFIDTRPEKK